MLRPILVVLTSILALAAGQSTKRCFVTNDWREGVLVPGEPNVLIWEDGGHNRDVLLNRGLDFVEGFDGVIARNVSQGSVFWIPPLNITKGDPDQLFAIQLWDMDNQMGCASPGFKFADVDTDAETTNQFYGPFVTTAISILETGYVTVTATVAESYQSDQAKFQQQVTGSITGSDEAMTSGTFTSSPDSLSTSTSTSRPTSSSASNNEDKDSGPNTIAIVIGTIGGVLVLALVVLSVLLWRARRRRARANATEERAEPVSDPKDISPSSTPESQLSEVDATQAAMAEVSGDTARHEMMGSSSAPQELASQNMDPVELPADEIPPPSYPHWETEVSPTTGDSRRSSLSFDKGTFTVSPVSDRTRDRKE